MPETRLDASSRPYYITTTLPYVNADPHIGFAMELVHADVFVRYERLMGREVFFNTGTDEHGQKILQAAQAARQEVQAYTDHYAAQFRKLPSVLGVVGDINFIRTTDPLHVAAAQEFWKRCVAAGDIYKKQYQTKYCVGCELEKTDSELVDGKCPIHPKLEIELRNEENYFFRFSKYQKPLLDLYASRPDFVVPDFRFNEIKAFLERGLADFSISRLTSKMSWGIPVPGDSEHVMYVWFDALVNYISAVGWPHDMSKFKKWWQETGGVIQFAGKDQIRMQAAMWQAMLMSAGLPPSKQIVIHGFVTGEGGVKMSKSLGNTADPYKLVNEYGTDAVRYFVCREFSPFEDSSYSPERFKEAYNANLANGLGNLTSRLLTLAAKYLERAPEIPPDTIPDNFKKACEQYNAQEVANIVWKHIKVLDQRIQETKVFSMLKTDPEKGKAELTHMIIGLYTIARMLNPLMPETNSRIKTLIKENKPPSTPLFPRRE